MCQLATFDNLKSLLVTIRNLSVKQQQCIV